MATRSLNKVQLIGNLTRDPELRYTPQGTAVCTFGLATNRQWVTDSGEKKEDVEFHRIVAWNKLAEICSQLLVKGRRVYIEGRLSTRSWQGQDGAQHQTTEIVTSDMIILDSKGVVAELEVGQNLAEDLPAELPDDNAQPAPESPKEQPADKKGGKKDKTEGQEESEEMPF